jgi:hypothetical protein
VFAGLVDDPYHINPRNYTAMTQDLQDGTNRYWFSEHLRSRDGVDFFMNAGGYPKLPIPGGFYSRPFRSLGYVDQPSGATSEERSLQNTLLRQRNTTTGHGLYEARASSDIGTDTIDYHTRNRILSKIANNSTTRSHVFFVWMGLDFFDAHVNSNNNIQIGGKAEDLPTYRAFCVVDMSRLEEAYNPITNTFDFRKFIIHRQLLP